MEGALSHEGRAKSVVLFEAVSIFSAVADMVLSQGENAFVELALLLLVLGLTLWVTRGRSRVARLIYTGVLLLGELAISAAYVRGYVPSGVQPTLLLLVSMLMGLLLLSLLWWPSTTTWLKSRQQRA